MAFENGQELTHTRSERDLLGLAGCQQTLVQVSKAEVQGLAGDQGGFRVAQMFDQMMDVAGGGQVIA